MRLPEQFDRGAEYRFTATAQLWAADKRHIAIGYYAADADLMARFSRILENPSEPIIPTCTAALWSNLLKNTRQTRATETQTAFAG